MGNRQELTIERADLALLTVLNFDQVRPALQILLRKLVTHEAKGERRSVEVELEVAHLFEQIRESADVVLVHVGDDAAFDAMGVVLDEREVRQNRVDTGLRFVGEHLAAVEYDHPTVGFENGAVSADVAESAEKCDLHRSRHDQNPGRPRLDNTFRASPASHSGSGPIG